MSHHVILGAGPAGVIAAESLRKFAPADRITLIGDEPEAPYSRMAIPYLLIGNIDEAGTHLRKSATHFTDHRIDVLHARANGVDAAAKTVQLSDGQTISFDTLLIATGSRPVHPPIKGMDESGVHTCWTMDDARQILALAKPGARVLQMGAGFIGCIILEALASRGVDLTVVEMGDRMVPRMMGPAAGGMIKSWCQTKGVQVFTGIQVQGISRQAPQGFFASMASALGLGADATGSSKQGPLYVQLSNGKTVEADLVISATGVKPCIDFLSNSAIACKTGVLTDAHLQTNVAGIFAAGDCAEAFDHASGAHVVSAIQPTAAEEARLAALNMLSHSRAQTLKANLKQVPQINVLDTLGLISSSFGDWAGKGDHAELTDEHAGKHISLQFEGDVLIGCNAVGWTDHVGAMRGLVDGKVHLGEWKHTLKQDPTKIMEAYLACAQGQGHWSGANDTRRRA